MSCGYGHAGTGLLRDGRIFEHPKMHRDSIDAKSASLVRSCTPRTKQIGKNDS